LVIANRSRAYQQDPSPRQGVDLRKHPFIHLFIYPFNVLAARDLIDPGLVAATFERRLKEGFYHFGGSIF
jgi:hypothetical protein